MASIYDTRVYGDDHLDIPVPAVVRALHATLCRSLHARRSGKPACLLAWEVTQQWTADTETDREIGQQVYDQYSITAARLGNPDAAAQLAIRLVLTWARARPGAAEEQPPGKDAQSATVIPLRPPDGRYARLLAAAREVRAYWRPNRQLAPRSTLDVLIAQTDDLDDVPTEAK